MRGILAAAGYLPVHRLERAEVRRLFGSGGGAGTRAVAAHDQDSTTMAVEAARLALGTMHDHRGADRLWFTTTSPAYLDKSNASVVHAALRLPAEIGAYDFGGGLRSSTGALLAALDGEGETVLVAADRRDGLPTSADEVGGGDGAACLVIGKDEQGSPAIATLESSAAVSDEFLDRWRAPGEATAKLWEERFGETRFLALGREALSLALERSAGGTGDIDRVIVTGMHHRAVSALGKALRLPEGVLVDDLSATTGQTGTAHPLLLLASVLEEIAESEAGPINEMGDGRRIALVNLADGADVLVFRTTSALAHWRPVRSVTDQAGAGRAVPYGKYLTWRGMVTVEPPRRPEPARVSSTAAWRSERWKFGFVGSKDRTTQSIHLPPSRVSMDSGAFDEMEPAPMADATGTIVTFTVDRMAYSPSPPVIFAVVDFDGGGRFPLELADADEGSIAVGDRVAMTFRRLFTADGIHDYFWKGRIVPDQPEPAPGVAPGEPAAAGTL